MDGNTLSTEALSTRIVPGQQHESLRMVWPCFMPPKGQPLVSRERELPVCGDIYFRAPIGAAQKGGGFAQSCGRANGRPFGACRILLDPLTRSSRCGLTMGHPCRGLGTPCRPPRGILSAISSGVTYSAIPVRIINGLTHLKFFQVGENEIRSPTDWNVGLGYRLLRKTFCSSGPCC